MVNEGPIRYDWRSDIDEDFRGKPKAGEGFLGRPATGDYYYAVYQHKVFSFGGTLGCVLKMLVFCPHITRASSEGRKPV